MRFGWNIEKVPGADFDYASIGKRRCGRTRQYEPNMFNLAATLSQIAPYVFGPAPSRLICRAANGHTSKAYEFETAEGHFAHLIRFLEALQHHFRVFRIHGFSLAGVISAREL